MSLSPLKRAASALGLVAVLAASPAAAQTLSTNSASYNGGYGRYSGQENRPIENFSNRDANGNMLIVGGLIQGGASTNSSTTTSSSVSLGSMSSWAGGVGGGSSSASAIGNNLSVVTQGNNNVVIVNSTQVNTGNITAGAQTQGGDNAK
jgi:holdfast attachment protein HfaA